MQNHIIRAIHLNPAAARPSNDRQAGASVQWTPKVDISEDDHEYLIKAEIPDVPKEEVKVTVENGVLTFSGERKFQNEERGRKYHRLERSYGSFMRSLEMPDDVDSDKVTADFKDGLLRIRLPKSEARKPRQIEVAVN